MPGDRGERMKMGTSFTLELCTIATEASPLFRWRGLLPRCYPRILGPLLCPRSCPTERFMRFAPLLGRKVVHITAPFGLPLLPCAYYFHLKREALP